MFDKSRTAKGSGEFKLGHNSTLTMINEKPPKSDSEDISNTEVLTLLQQIKAILTSSKKHEKEAFSAIIYLKTATEG